jgi:pimeloyl-ACP methyl ester carboxylesterase
MLKNLTRNSVWLIFFAAGVFMSLAAAQAPRSDAPLPRERVTAIIDGVRKITTKDGIDTLEAVQIGGIEQWLSVRGKSRENPLLLFVHGGPASTDMPVSWAFQTPWEDYFTVVQWDQRGAGKTYVGNDPAKIGPTLDIERMVADASEVVQYLRKTYAKPKIFVLGHSWGSVIGLDLAHRHPEWLYAYIGMGQIINMREGERLSYSSTLRLAREAKHATAIKELEALAPYPEADGSVSIDKLGIERKWSVFFGGLTHGRNSFDYYGDAALLSPDYTTTEVAAIDKGSALSLPRLFPALTQVDFTTTTELNCPLVIFNGRYDDTTPATLTARWFENVHAPSKQIVWFENSAHMMHIEEPGRMLVHLVTEVLPLAK